MTITTKEKIDWKRNITIGIVTTLAITIIGFGIYVMWLGYVSAAHVEECDKVYNDLHSKTVWDWLRYGEHLSFKQCWV